MITMTEPNVGDYERYSPKQAAALLGVHRNTLRAYTDSSLIKCRFHQGTMRKFYYGKDILRFWRAFV